METHMHHHHDRSMLPQPKTNWKCACGAHLFIILMCPECRGEEEHVIGFECVACETIHLSPSGGSLWEEDENARH